MLRTSTEMEGLPILKALTLKKLRRNVDHSSRTFEDTEWQCPSAMCLLFYTPPVLQTVCIHACMHAYMFKSIVYYSYVSNIANSSPSELCVNLASVALVILQLAILNGPWQPCSKATSQTCWIMFEGNHNP